MTKAEEEFETWWNSPKPPVVDSGENTYKQGARMGWLASREATAQRCCDLCMGESDERGGDHAADCCAALIAEEFGLEDK